MMVGCILVVLATVAYCTVGGSSWGMYLGYSYMVVLCLLVVRYTVVRYRVDVTVYHR